MTRGLADPRRAIGIALAAGASLLLVRPAQASDAFNPPPAPPRLGSCGPNTGGFRLPGTEGCLRINGFVAADGAWSVASPNVALSRDPVGPSHAPAAGTDLTRSALGAEARLSADLHLPTEYGPMRVYVSVRGRNGLATGSATH